MSSDDMNSATEIRIDGTSRLAILMRDSPPQAVVDLTIFRQQREAPEIFLVIHVGRLFNRHWGGDHVLRLDSHDGVANERRTALAPRYQKRCRHPHYGLGCGLVAATWAEGAEVDAIAGSVISTSDTGAFAEGYFAMGYLTYPDYLTGITAKRDIIASTTTTVTVYGEPVRLEAGDTITLYPGCNRTTDCADKFDNLLNGGMCPAIPDKEPSSADTPLF